VRQIETKALEKLRSSESLGGRRAKTSG